MLFVKNNIGFYLFAEVVCKIDAGETWNMILPIGRFHTKKYGDIAITRDEALALVKNWNEKAMGEREAFIDTDHDLGPSNGWIKALEVRDAQGNIGPGVWALVDWTERGRDLVQKKIYKYLSAMFGPHQNITTGQVIKPV